MLVVFAPSCMMPPPRPASVDAGHLCWPLTTLTAARHGFFVGVYSIATALPACLLLVWTLGTTSRCGGRWTRIRCWGHP